MAESDSTYHTPVLLQEVVSVARNAERAVDATLGGGGHAAALRAAGLRILAVDRDAAAIAAARAHLGDDAIEYLHAPYDAPEVLEAVAAFRPDLALFDLGVSSRQLDDDTRGFSFRPGVRLDMRMGDESQSATDLLNDADVGELERIFAQYGDERRARKLAATVARRRARQPFATSDDLVNAIRAALGPRSGPGDFARLFQAVRIAVNDELEGLGRALPAYRDALVPAGVLAVITYHSGEDRLVKHLFREWADGCTCPPDYPVCRCGGIPLGTVEPRKPIVPGPDEVASNPRARSAKLRIFRTRDAT